MVFTNGDYKKTTISCIIEFIDEYEENINEYKEWIINEERDTAQHGESIQIVKILQGAGYVSEYFPSDYRANAGQNRRGTGTNSKGNSSKDSEVKDFSLKDSVDVSPKKTTEYLDAVEDVQKGKKGAAERLAKYVDEGMIRTEAYEQLVEKYGSIPKGEKPHRDESVPAKTEKDKKVSQTVRTILEAKATPDELVPTVGKMVEDGVFSYG